MPKAPKTGFLNLRYNPDSKAIGYSAFEFAPISVARKNYSGYISNFDDFSEAQISCIQMVNWPAMDETWHMWYRTVAPHIIVDKKGIVIYGQEAIVYRHGGTKEENLVLAKQLVKRQPITCEELIMDGFKYGIPDKYAVRFEKTLAKAGLSGVVVEN